MTLREIDLCISFDIFRLRKFRIQIGFRYLVDSFVFDGLESHILISVPCWNPIAIEIPASKRSKTQYPDQNEIFDDCYHADSSIQNILGDSDPL